MIDCKTLEATSAAVAEPVRDAETEEMSARALGTPCARGEEPWLIRVELE